MSLLNKIKKIVCNDKTNKRIKWSLYARVWREIGLPQWRWLLFGIIATIGAASAEAYSIVILQKVVDKAFIDKNAVVAYFLALQVILAFGLKGAFSYAKSLIMSKTGLLASANLQKRIYNHVVKMDISKFYGDGIGKFLNYFTVQSSAVLTLVTTTIVETINQFATLIMTLGLMVYYAPQMCAVLFFLVPAVLAPMILIMRKTRKLSRKSFTIANEVAQDLNQTLHGIKTIQAFAKEDYESKRFSHILNSAMSNTYKTTQAKALRAPLMEMTISIGLGIALVMGAKFISSGTLSVGDFTAFLLALTAAYKPAKRVTGSGDSIQHGLLAAEVLFDFLDSKPSIQDIRGAKILRTKKPSISFEHIDFSYKPNEPVLRDLNLHIPSGKVCALVGQSGGGKTTLFNLLERFYTPQSGRITINKTDIKKFTLKSLRQNIAEVSQDVFLFNGTITENIKYGAPNATQDQVIYAAKMANAHDFIMSFPDGYDSNIGENGSLLSGGQKQRIAIARAILKDAPILLLDEATSALDTESEKQIQNALKKLMRGRTTFVIAHRLSTIIDADIICVIKNGQIIEQGTDAELTKLNGEYKRLRDIQLKKK